MNKLLVQIIFNVHCMAVSSLPLYGIKNQTVPRTVMGVLREKQLSNIF